ncbi:MAG: thiamine pyrophosphate-requiring protein [Chloroflexota bacterium]
MSGADALLLGLKEIGVDYIFGNTGTDFPPILGSFAKFQQAGRLGKDVPIPITIPHENVAVNMANGYYLATGKPQVIFVHTNVGTANALMGMIDANRAQVPMIVIAGRAPTTEQYNHTSKPGFIHWAQDMFDQAGMVRENVKWDYHISSDNIVELDLILQRAMTMAMAYPPGPVYLTFVPEAVEAEIEMPATIAPPMPTTMPYPDPTAVSQVVAWLEGAKRPLISTGGTARDLNILPALQQFAETHSVGVTSMHSRNLHFPFSHDLYLGDDPHMAIAQADLIISLETDVPYMPLHGRPPEDCRIVHVGPDPVFQRYPRRGYRADANISSGIVPFLAALDQQLSQPSNALRQQRHAYYDQIRQRKAAARQREINKGQQNSDITKGWVSHCVAEAAKAHDDLIVLREFDLKADFLALDQPGSYFGLSNAGGLGWGHGTSLGLRLAQPDKIPLLVTGDGCYYFNTPAAAHSVANSQDLPFITVIFNNGQWGTVAMHTNRWYPQLEEPHPPLTSLGKPADFEKIVAAFNGYGERVEQVSELPTALERAIQAVRSGQQAVINVVV